MIFFCTHLLETVQSAWDTIVVIGTGQSFSLSALRQLQPKRLILVEPHPDQADVLSQQICTGKGEEIRPLAITPQDAPHALLHVFSNPAYNSLCPPHELKRFVPNLRKKASIEVPAVGLNAFLQDLNLPPEEDNLLIIAAPGQSTALLANVAPHLVQMFTWILLAGNEIPGIYQGEEAMDDLVTRGKHLGFDLESRDPDCLYPQAAALLHRNAKRVRITSLELLAAELKDKLRSGEKMLADFQARIQSLEDENEQIAKIARERLDTISNLTKKRDALAAEKDELIKERDNQARTAAQRQNALDRVTKERDVLAEEKTQIANERDDHAKIVNERQQALDKLVRERNELQKSLDAEKQARAHLETELQSRQEHIQQLEVRQPEVDQRQQLMQEELVKAEAQIDLIRDLLLREPGL
jgi:hypothetical protein